LGALVAPAGALLGLQASGLPSGAQQLPMTTPCGALKLQAAPAGTALQAAKASAGGGGGGGGRSLGWAQAQAESIAVAMATKPSYPRAKRLMVMKVLLGENSFDQAVTKPHCARPMRSQYGNFPTICT